MEHNNADGDIKSKFLDDLGFSIDHGTFHGNSDPRRYWTKPNNHGENVHDRVASCLRVGASEYNV